MQSVAVHLARDDDDRLFVPFFASQPETLTFPLSLTQILRLQGSIPVCAALSMTIVWGVSTSIAMRVGFVVLVAERTFSTAPRARDVLQNPWKTTIRAWNGT